MAVKIRLRRMGRKKKAFYRFVVADSRSPRDGKFIQAVGTYNPVERPAKVALEEEKIYSWLKKGATPTPTVYSLLRQVGLLRKWEKIGKKEDVSAIQLATTIKEKKRKKRKKTKEAVPKVEKEPKPAKSGEKKEEQKPQEEKKEEQ